MCVDDSNILIASQEPEEDQTSIRNRTQKFATVCSAEVHQTGGAIRPENVGGILYLING